MKVIALDPSTNNVTVKVGDEYNWDNIVSYITNGLDIDLNTNSNSERTTNKNDFYKSDLTYSVSSWNASDKTFVLTSNITTQSATITRSGYNEITLAGFGNSDGEGNSTLSGANASIIDKGDFVEFTNSGAYSGNVYPVQSNDGNFIQIYDPATTSNTTNRTAVVYTGFKETRSYYRKFS